MTKPIWNDALAFFGRNIKLDSFQSGEPAALDRMLDRHGIARALVQAYAGFRLHPAYGQELLFKACAKRPRWIPCPAILPDAGLETGDERAHVAELVERGARAVALYPTTCRIPLDRSVVGPLCSALERHRLPLMLNETGMPAAAELAREYPRLPVIVPRPGYRNRELIPPLRIAANLHIAIAAPFVPYRGLEVLVKAVGAERLLFATGFPESSPGAALTHVLYSDISDATLAMIAGGNLLRLVEDVRIKAGPVFRPARKLPAVTVKAGRPGLDSIARAAFTRKPLPWKGIVDIHGHYGKWVEFPIWGGDADDLVAEMDRIGIQASVVSHQAVLSSEVQWGNDEVFKGMQRHPGRILGYATCLPINDKLGIDEIKRCVDRGMPAIKLHSYNGIPYDAPAYRKIWEYADKLRMPVLLHTWGDLNTYRTIFEKAPNTPILCGHSGAVNPNQYVEYARQFPNIHLELCSSRSADGLVEFFVREIGAERVVWGSDAPWLSYQQQIGRVLFADIPESAKRLILAGNAKRILGKRWKVNSKQ